MYLKNGKAKIEIAVAKGKNFTTNERISQRKIRNGMSIVI